MTAVGRGGSRTAPTRPSILGALLLLALAAAALAAPATVHAESPAEYREVVARALAVAESGAAGSPSEAGARAAGQEALAVVRRLLDAVSVVDLGDGRQVALANPPLHVALADGDLERVRMHLAALLAALDAAAAAQPPPSDARARLAAVLARPEFHTREPGPLDRLLQPLREAWDGLRRRLLSLLSGTRLGGDGVVFVVIGLVVVLGLAAVLAGVFGGNVVAGARAATPGVARGPSARATRDRAFALAERGNYREAIHELYLATLVHLDERGLLRFRPSLTNREHLARGEVAPEVAPVLTPLVEGYDHLWYGGVRCTADDWSRFAALADAAWQPVSRSAAPARARDGGVA